MLSLPSFGPVFALGGSTPPSCAPTNALLCQREIDVDFDGRLIRRGNEFPFMDSIFRGSSEHVVAADGLGCRDAAIGRYSCGDAHDAADAHASSQLGVRGRYALFNRALVCGVKGHGNRHRRGKDCESHDRSRNPPLSFARVLKIMPFHLNHPWAKDRLTTLSAQG